MMQKEFEQIAGYEVSTEDYNQIIEPMYMALPNVTKADFVKMIDKKRFALATPAELLRKIKKEAKHLYEICGRYTDYESESRLEKLIHEYANRKFGLDWTWDMKAYAFWLRGYEYPEIKRGCTYPKEMVIGRDNTEYERVTLVK